MATKVETPALKMAANLTPGSVEPAMKAAEAKTTKLYKVPIAKIKVMPGFNVRVQSAEYLEHRDMIAASIKANGFDQTKPVAGYVAKEGDENVIYLTDGHTRLDAVAVVNGDPDVDPRSEITTLPVLVHPGTASLTDLTVALHTSNTGRPLTPFELGVVVKRLMSEEGADKTQLAARLAVTPRYLDDVLLLVDAPKQVREAVMAGNVSSTLAIQEIRKDPKSAVAKITKAVADNKASGGTGKVTRKALGPKMQKVRTTVSLATGTDVKDVLKALAAFVRQTVKLTEDGDVQNLATDGTISLVIEVPAPEKSVKPIKVKPPKKTTPSAATLAAAAAAPVEDENLPETGEDDDSAGTDDDLGITGAEEVTSDGLDDEIAQLPPAVGSDPEVPDDI